MSLLSIFTIMYKADTSDLEKGQDKVRQSTEKTEDKIKKSNESGKKSQEGLTAAVVETNRQVKNTNNATQGLSVSFVDMAKQAAAALGIVVGVGAAVKAVFNSDKAVLQLNRTAKALGENVEKLETWDRLVKNQAGEGASVTGDIQQFDDHLRRSVVVGGQIQNLPADAFLQNLAAQGGIDLLNPDKTIKSYDQVFVAISEKLDKLRKGYQAQGRLPEEYNPLLASAARNIYNLSPGLAISLLQSPDKVKQQYADIRPTVPTQADNDRLDEFAQKWGKVRQAIVDVSVNATGPLLDLFGKLINGYSKLSKYFETGFLKDPFGFIITEVKDLYSWVIRLGKAFEALFSGGSIAERIQAFRDALSVGSTDKSALAGKPSNAALAAAHAANRAVNNAASSPINSQSQNSIINNNSSPSSAKSVHIGSVSVHTQATDADGIASALNSAIARHSNQATLSLGSDGILA